MKLKHLQVVLIIVISLVSHLLGDETYDINKRGNSLYKSKQYKESIKQYDDAILLSPSDARLKMNKGSAHYQIGELDKAEEAYTAALSSGNKDQLADAHYNMGNILFKQGAQMYQSQSQQQQAIEKFKGAYEQYIKSLDLRPSDYDAKWNLQLAAG
jgi:tetratricopeptide (TPR) repeat protein